MISSGSGILALTACVLIAGDATRPSLLISTPEDVPPESAPDPIGIDEVLPEAVALPDRGRMLRDDELTAYFTQGRLLKAKLAFDTERYGEALLLLAREGDAPPVRLLRALCQLELGQTAAAAEHLIALAEVYPPMRDECLVRAGAASERLDRVLDAADAYRRVSPASPRYLEARLALSRLWLQRGDLDDSLAALEPLLALPQLDREARGEAFLARAAVAAARKDAAAEREALSEVFAEGLEHQVRAATIRLHLQGGVPALATARRAISLIERRRVPQALALVRPLVKKASPDALVCAERLAQGLTLHAERDFEAAAATLSEAVARCKAEPARPRALLSLAMAQAEQTPRDARHTLDKLVSEFPASPLAATALIEAADIDLGNGEVAKARARLGQAGHVFGANPLAADSLFRSFWLSWKTDKASADVAPLTVTAELPAGGATALQRERARYWLGRVLQERGEAGPAAVTFASLARDARASFYGLLALGRLSELNTGAAEELGSRPIIPPSAARWPLYTGPEGEEPRLLTTLELVRLGMPEASKAVSALSRRGQSPERARLIFELLRLCGDDQRAGAFARQASRDHQGEWSAEDGALFAAAFPRPFGELVDKHAAAVGIEPALLQALIREESAFNPNARSWAGAMGLAQLMVPTAREVAHQLGAGWTGAASLYDPDFNLRLGSRYLANVMKRFGGNPYFAVASYNAGPGRVSGWLKSRAPGPMDEWVEDIPFEETRWYVKRVLASENVYKRLLTPDRLASAD